MQSNESECELSLFCVELSFFLLPLLLVVHQFFQAGLGRKGEREKEAAHGPSTTCYPSSISHSPPSLLLLTLPRLRFSSRFFSIVLFLPQSLSIPGAARACGISVKIAAGGLLRFHLLLHLPRGGWNAPPLPYPQFVCPRAADSLFP